MASILHVGHHAEFAVILTMIVGISLHPWPKSRQPVIRLIVLVGHRALVFPHDCLGILVVDAVLLGYIIDTASVLFDSEPNQGLFGQVVDFLIPALLGLLGLV